MARPRKYVQAPTVTPLPFGIVSAAIVLDDLDEQMQLGYQYEPEACGVANTTRGACEDEAAELDQSTEGIPLVLGDPFTLYSLFMCRPIGVDLVARAKDNLRVGEGRGLEAAIAERLPVAAGAVDLAPGETLHPLEGLAVLEGFAAQNYGGVPTIHVPRTAGSLLGSLSAVARYGSRLETVQGAIVASGGGYEGLAGPLTDVGDPETVQTPDDGEAWLYVTGQVVVRRSSTTEATPLVMSRTAGQRTNDMLVLAHRAYGVSWECVTAAVKVSTHYTAGILAGA